MKYAGRFLRVKNLDRYQHYRDRNPPWIKLHQELLEDYDFGCLQDASKAHALCIMLLASRCDNKLPADPEWIGRRINATDAVDLDALLSCSFLELVPDCKQTASDPLADCKQLAMLEGEGEGEQRRGEQSRGAAPDPAGPTPPAAASGALEFPVTGKERAWRLTKLAQDRLQLAYPALDVPAVCRRALAWVEANPTKRKTARGMPRFLDDFMAREQENPKSAYRRNGTGSLANGNGAHPKATTLEPSAAMRFSMERTKLRAELFEREDLAEADRDRLVTALDAVQPSAGVAALRAAVSA